ncbi:MAG: Metallophosphoesterase [Pedosphaera sp.]|nr:Metallophosphoesterase [Pedosphaera sp.]
MPIHLPPVSRRRFLAGSLAAGAGLLLDQPLFAATRATDVHTWALLSDTHLAADRQKIERAVNMTDNFKAIALEVCGLKHLPATVLINGDLALGSGEPGDYAVIADLLQPLREAGMPVHLTLGNHDDRNHFWTALADAGAAARPVADRHVALLRSPRANWFVLDSLEKTNSTPGLLGDSQLAWLARTLDENKDKPALVMAHHNLPVMGDPKMAIKDSEQLLEIIRPHRQVKAYIFGHTHSWGIQQDVSGIHLINLPPTSYLFTPGKPNGWVLATLQRHGVRLDLHCLDLHHPAHGQKVDLKWRAT